MKKMNEIMEYQLKLKNTRWLCGVYDRGVGSNLIQCTSCHK